MLDINEEGYDELDLLGYHDITDYIIGDYTEDVITAIHAVKPFSLSTVTTFINSYFFPLYQDDVIISLNYLPNTRAEMVEILKAWGRKFVVKVKETYDRYTTLVDYYDEKRDELLAQIRTSSENRVNDTPQNGGDYVADSYTSLYNKQDVASDRDTPMERIAQIDRDYRNLYKDWAKDFEGLFITSAIDFEADWEYIDNGRYYS